MENQAQPQEGGRQPFQKIRLKDRTGFETRSMRWVYRVLYPFFHCSAKLPEELRDSDEPVVFIANHYNAFGPASFVISVPVESRIWLNDELIEKESAIATITPTIRKMFPFLSEKTVSRLCEKLSWGAVNVLTRFGVIPVNRQDPSKLISTMRQSVAALEQGQNLVIFPEIGLPEYSMTSVTEFYSGFAMLGKLYHRKTGKILRFCPCYIDEQHHEIRFGEMVTYDPEADSREETQRVSDELNLRIREMAAENRGVEKEEVSPGRRTVLFFCNLARTLLLIPLFVMLGIPNPGMILLFYLISEGVRIVFNVVCNTFAASNRLSFLFSHGIGLITDISVLFYLTSRTARLRWLLYATIANGVIILASNILNYGRYRRCAGVNYFDTLSANLLFLICVQQLTGVLLSRIVLMVLSAAAMVFLGCSAGFTLAFNARIGQEEESDAA